MKFSIITVVKNDKNNILKTINSVKNQNYKNFEHIIIDGSSTDGTTEIIKKNLRKNKDYKHIIKKDKNLYDALNYGLKISKGECIGILHSGDIFFSNKILNIVKQKINIVDAVSGNIIYKKKNKIIRQWKYKIDKLNKYNCFKIAHTSLFLKKKMINKIKKYDIQYSIASDTDFILQLAKLKSLKYYYIDQNIVIMNIGGLSTSLKNFLNKIFQDLKIYNKHFGINFIFFYLFKLSYKLYKML